MLGIRHGIDWDHIAAITDITSSAAGDEVDDEEWLVREPGLLLTDESHHAIADAIAIVNATGYGLTSAIHSLDDREIDQWKQGIRAGNLYVNRGTTGAIVLRERLDLGQWLAIAAVTVASIGVVSGDPPPPDGPHPDMP